MQTHTVMYWQETENGHVRQMHRPMDGAEAHETCRAFILGGLHARVVRLDWMRDHGLPYSYTTFPDCLSWDDDVMGDDGQIKPGVEVALNKGQRIVAISAKSSQYTIHRIFTAQCDNGHVVSLTLGDRVSVTREW